MPKIHRALCIAVSLSALSLAGSADLRAEVDLEMVSKKMSLWPRKITLTQDVPLKIKQPDGSTQSSKIPKGSAMEVVSVQPKGVEVAFQNRTIILPAAVTDLEAQVAAKAAALKGASGTGATPQTPGSQPEHPFFSTPSQGASQSPSQGVDEDALKRKLAAMSDDGNVTLDELKQLSPQEIAKLPPAMQKSINDAINSRGASLQGDGGRPKPTLQSREITPFIKELSDNTAVLQGTNLKKHTASFSFKDKDYYLLFFGAGQNDNTKKAHPIIDDFYKKVSRVSNKFELIYVPMDRNPQSMEASVKEMKLTCPIMTYSQEVAIQKMGKFMGNSVPSLVVVDRAGNVISSSHREPDKNQFQPEEVLLDLASLLQIPPNTLR